ncbi:MAG: gamma-glutamyltransferase family protein [Acidobacteria bacterium]|nr:gamma-glutamyltransferase family protein [Acidobacteriota bacterium]
MGGHRKACSLSLILSATITASSFASQGATTLKPLVAGKRGAVAAGHPLVAEAGLRILQKGGNAIDAGVATVFAAAVVEMDGFGMGAECPILIKLKEGAPVAVNGAGTAPDLATVEFYKTLRRDDPRLTDVAAISRGTIPGYGLLSAIVPSAVDSLLLALEKYGTLSFAEVIQPAIELAEGCPLDPRFARGLERYKSIIEKWPTSKKVCLPGGRAPKAGELYVQADLARTFRSMAEAEKRSTGRDRVVAIEAVRDYFYRGPVAKEISDFCKQAGCLLREGDFAAFRAKIEPPLSTNYRGVDVFKVSFWSQSPVFLQNLNLLEGFDLRATGQNSADYIHTVVEAMKLGYADRDAYYGDPDFSAIPISLISKEYAALRRPLIDMSRASAEHIPGDPAHMQARASADFIKARYADRNGEHEDTTCVNVIDSAGNMFSATPSGAWFPAVIAGSTGIPLSHRAQSFVLTPGHPNQLAPRKRPRVTLTPTLALKNKRPWLAFSTPCGDAQDQTLLQVFLNVAEFGMNPQEAVEAPRFNSRAMYSSFDDHSDSLLVVEVEKRVPDSVIGQLRARGHKVEIQGDWGNSCAPTIVEYNSSTSVVTAGADVRGHRYALAW